MTRVRYAPSPTGSPHVGNIRTAIFNWLFARHTGGVFVARLEDTDRDPLRYQPHSIHDIESSLNGLGLTPDEWWVSGGNYGPYVQSERLSIYRLIADRLVAQGSAYRCYCTPDRLSKMRDQQQATGGATGYDRRCRQLSRQESEKYLSDGLPYTIRLSVPLDGKTTFLDEVYGEISVENKLVDDQVLLKSNGWPTYHLAVVVDDHEMAITHVIRGEDWLPSAPKQVLLYQMLDWQQPVWAHLPLILGTDKKKLGKRHGATKFVEFLHEGYLQEALFNFLVLCGWSSGEENREIFTRKEIIERFTLDSINRSSSVFDYEKLRWMNGEYIRSMSSADLERTLSPKLIESGLVSNPPSQEQCSLMAKVFPLLRERIKVLNEVPGQAEFFFQDPEAPDSKGRTKWLSGPDAVKRLDAIEMSLSAIHDVWTVDALDEAASIAAAALSVGRGPIIHTLRIATTGRTIGPGLFETLEVLGREAVLRRLNKARSWIVES